MYNTVLIDGLSLDQLRLPSPSASARLFPCCLSPPRANVRNPLQAVAVVGEVGSGKSTLVAGILGEVPVFPTHNYAGRNVKLSRLQRPAPARGGREQGENAVAPTRADIVCYAAQTPWVMSGTVRDNILFGLPMEKKRYR